jgi:Flp pilus assembly protein TadD
MRSTIVGELAGCALRTGRDDEALRLAELARSLTGADDVISQVLWRSARAVALSRRGELEEADRLGREAVELGRRGEYFRYRCVAFSALADVRANAGDTAEAVALLEELVATAEAKGSVVRAERARARIAELSAVAG